jgi:hypothetical protein
MNCARIALIAGALVSIAAPGLRAQPRWGNPAVPRSGACFYRDADFRGEYFCAPAGENIPNLAGGMNDQISSIRVFGSAEVTIYVDSRFRGQSARFFNDVRNLRFQGWNDRLSSIQVRRGSGWIGGGRPPEWGNGSMPREGACFYTDADFRGRSFCVPRGGSYSSVPNGFNDRISSIRVRRANVMIFSDGDFGGRTTRVGSDVANLGGQWNDRISSLRVY